jgi:predicted 3-demethylubiquinone-9 3-methyltransferase (glyoxalase superfamily)
MSSPRFATCLWFAGAAEEAARLYTSVLDDAEITQVSRQAPDAPAVTVAFRLGTQEFTALNGQSAPPPTEAASIMIRCTEQRQVDRFWDGLTADGGEPGRCGWLKDRFGISWQVVPDRLVELLSSPDSDAAGRVMEAMLTMGKIEISELEDAARAKS